MNTGLPKAIHWEKPPVKDRHCLQNQPHSHCSQLPLPQIDVSDSSLLASRSSFLACVCPTGGVLFLLETMSIVTLHVPSSIITHVYKAWQARDTHRAQPRSSFRSHVCQGHTWKGEKTGHPQPPYSNPHQKFHLQRKPAQGQSVPRLSPRHWTRCPCQGLTPVTNCSEQFLQCSGPVAPHGKGPALIRVKS